MSVLTSRAGFYKIEFDSVSFPLNDAEVSEFLEGLQLKMKAALF